MKKPRNIKFVAIKVYESVQQEFSAVVEEAREAGGDTNISRILRRMIEAYKAKA